MKFTVELTTDFLERVIVDYLKTHYFPSSRSVKIDGGGVHSSFTVDLLIEEAD